MITIDCLAYLFSFYSDLKVIDTEEYKDDGNRSMKDRKLEEQNQVNHTIFNITGNLIHNNKFSNMNSFYDISFYSQQMVCLTSEEDSKWKKMRYLPITKVLEHFEHEHKRELK